MANTLTDLAPVIFAPGKMVPQELTGFLGAIRIDTSNQGQAVGDTVKVPVAPVMSAATVTPSQTFTVGSDRVASTKSIVLSNFREVKWHYTAEEERSLGNSQTAQEMLRQTLAQAWRTLRNEIEADVAATVYKGSSRAYGTAGTTPFASDLTAAANIAKILKDNGVLVEPSSVSLVIDTAASVKLMGLVQLTDVDRSGGDDALRRGVLRDLFGIAIRESAQVQAHTKGAGVGYDINNGSGEAVGQTTLTLDGGTVNTTGIAAGDVVTLAGDTNKYVVNTGTTATGGDIVIGDPGLRIAAADATELTIGDSYTANVAMHRDAGVLVVRPGLQPQGAIAEQMVVTDPASGLSGLLLRVPGNALASWYLRIVYDTSVINSHAIATLLG